MSEIKMAS